MHTQEPGSCPEEQRRERARINARKWYARNRERKLEYQRQYDADHKEEINERVKRNPHIAAQKLARRRARLAAATLPGTDIKKIKEFYRRARDLTKLTGIQYEVDHVIPLCRGGAHHPDNLVICTRTTNRKKGNRIVPALIEFFGARRIW